MMPAGTPAVAAQRSRQNARGSTRVAGLLGCALCSLPGWTQKATLPQRTELVYIGTYGTVTSDGGPIPGHTQAIPEDANADPSALSHQGIYAARLDTQTGHLTALGMMAQVQRSSRLCVNPRQKVLYSTGLAGKDMRQEARVFSFQVDPGTGALTPMGSTGSGGQDSTDLHLDASTRTLFVANHGSGTISALPVYPDGQLGAPSSTQRDYGSGPSPRQAHAKVHGVLLDPSGQYLLSADFGADRIFVYRFEKATRTLQAATVAFEQAPSGSGPRHMVFGADGRFLYVDTELSAQILTYAWNAQTGTLRDVQATSLYPADWTGEKSAAELARSKDGRFLYVSLRGNENQIVVLANNLHSGLLHEVQRVSSMGRIPWSFGIDPSGQWMLVTNVGSGIVTLLRIDLATGRLEPTDQVLHVPDSDAVAFYTSR